ncbi:YrhK family protein [Salsipaludibacter albus]|uniref:YrhK family protein n=1 Tax=Salsipaludibacter albus TaxID=2849650 RepID=UPI001EE4812E|nr:YrhK family protein [Salsipaludibacter albus]MBY5163025.1 YrhK family protein [Salsipaludibacter albus]
MTSAPSETDTPRRGTSRAWRRRAIAWVEEFHWFHTSLGLFGNVAFFLGSVFFLSESLKTAGIWLFVVGSLGMLLGSLGDAVARAEDDT